MDHRKLIVLGLDCATPDILFSGFLDELPNLRRVLRGGTHGPIRSTDPPITVPAWTVMTASKNPGRLGFTGFRNRRRGAYADGFIATGDHVRAKRVWDYLGEANRKVVVHGVPQTFPAYPVEGVMTSSFLCPDATHPAFAFPEEVGAEVRHVAPDYAVDVRDFRTEDKEKLVREVRKCADDHFDAAEHFLRTREWDFFMMVEMGVDRIQHACWQFHDPAHWAYPGDDNPLRDAIRDHYRHVDARFGRLLALAPDDAYVMVVSDHGAKRMDGTVHVNEWLRREGYLVLKEEPKGPQAFREEDVDWSRTRAWAYGGYHARVFVNLKGREPDGVVEPHEYDGFLAELAAAARRIRGPDGAPIAGTIARRPEDEYGEWPDLDLSSAPDLHLYIGDMHWRASQSVGHPEVWGRDAEVGPDGATHDWFGVFGLLDPLNPRSVAADDLHIVDVCPTILRLFGVPIPEDLEGRPIDFEYPLPAAPPAPASQSAREQRVPVAPVASAAPSAHRALRDAAARRLAPGRNA